MNNMVQITGIFLFVSCVFLSPKAVFGNPAVPRSWEEHLEDQLQLLQAEIISNPEVITMVVRANEQNAHMTQEDIAKIDKQWRETEGADLFIVSLITNDLTDKLKALQKKHRTLVEIFVTDKRGLLIAATNKTSDFFQADEAWWQKTFRLKNQSGFLGDLEYDESSLAEAVSLYLPITNERREIIGVLKAVCSTNEILRVVS